MGVYMFYSSEICVAMGWPKSDVCPNTVLRELDNAISRRDKRRLLVNSDRVEAQKYPVTEKAPLTKRDVDHLLPLEPKVLVQIWYLIFL